MKITGLQETKDKLDDLDQKVQKTIVRRGVRAGCKVWLSAARGEAPSRSGKMRKNIKIRNGKSGRGVYSLQVGVNAKDFAGEAFYGSFVLFGHKVGSRKLGDKRVSVPANNFLQRTFDSTRNEAADTAVATIGEGIQAGTIK